MTRRASYVERLGRRAAGRPLALCAGLDPSPRALELVGADAASLGRRTARSASIERFCGLVVEAVRDHAIAIKPQLAWFEAAGADGIRALERVVAYARGAGLLVVLDGKRGDVPHSAAAYAQAWLGDDATSGIGGDALTVNAAVGADALEAMARVAADRACALYALVYTSNPGAETLQAAPLEPDGRPWWHLLAGVLARVDEQVGGGVVGGVVGATRPAMVDEARRLLPHAPLLLPGIGAQGGEVDALDALTGPTSLVAVSRSLLPAEPCDAASFRHAVSTSAAQVAAGFSGIGRGVSGVVG